MEDSRAWFVSAIAIPFDAFVYFKSHLYGDMLLQMVYLASTFYGYYQWRHGGLKDSVLSVSRLHLRQLLYFSSLVLSLAFGLFLLLSQIPSAERTALDGLTTALSLGAQYLLCIKKIETWLIWLLVDALYVYLYAIKALPFHSLMALCYLGLAVLGWYKWRTALQPAAQ